MICLDTAPVIWGVQGVARAGQEPMIEKTKRYIAHLDKTGKRIMIPTPVLSEYLMGFNPTEQDAQLRLLERHFFLPSLDVPAAALAAKILQDAEAVPMKKARKKVPRQELRVDAFIIAIAAVHRAEIVISNDEHF